ncbi:hypothetical protein HaLaN_16909, partial [Haematococcus lacustris]
MAGPKARSKLSATKEVEAVTSLQVAVAVAAAGDGGDAQGAAEVGALPDQAAAAAEAQLAEELHEEDLDAADEVGGRCQDLCGGGVR